MADFSKCVKGDKLVSKKYGEVEFILYHPELTFPVLGCSGPRLLTWTEDGRVTYSDIEADISIPPKTKTVKRYVGLVPDNFSYDGFFTVTNRNISVMLKHYPTAQDVHEIEFTVREEEE